MPHNTTKNKMKTYKICVETGCTGNDHYVLYIKANSMKEAIAMGYDSHKRNQVGRCQISESACHEVINETLKVHKMKKGEMLAKMLVIATNAHAGQFDRGGNAYILHPLKVMHYTKSDDEEIMCIALGHDVIEDTDVTYKDLRDAGLSDRIIAGIAALTKVPGQTLNEYKDSVFSNNDAMRVKLADLRHNTDIRRLKGATEKDIARMAKYHQFYMEIQAKMDT